MRNVYRFDPQIFTTPRPGESGAEEPADPDQDTVALGVSEDTLALDFTARNRDTLRFVAAFGKWFRWLDGVWQEDATLDAFNSARAVCREKAATLDKEWARARIASAKTVAAVVALAKADPVHARTPEHFDRLPFELNTPDGVVNLCTGEMKAPRPEDGHTRRTAVGPAGECPTWLACLDRWTAQDAEMVAFLSRLFGYCLSGSTREHVLPFFYGTGANGKSVCLNTIAGILADYAGVAGMDTFTASQGDRHPADLAMLRGRRLVVAQEVEAGRRWDEARLKALTGGDPVTARFMRGDFFTFTPTFKILLAGNHKPGLRAVDEAIRRRLLLVPFNVTVPPAERDPDLPAKLKAEWPGILAWMVRGALAWQAEGLRPPDSVRAASESYFEAENAFKAWLDDEVVRAPGLVVGAGDLFASWKSWAEKRNEVVGTQRRLGECLEAEGFERVKDVAGCRGRGWRGLGLRA